MYIVYGAKGSNGSPHNIYHFLQVVASDKNLPAVSSLQLPDTALSNGLPVMSRLSEVAGVRSSRDKQPPSALCPIHRACLATPCPQFTDHNATYVTVVRQVQCLQTALLFTAAASVNFTVLEDSHSGSYLLTLQ